MATHGRWLQHDITRPRPPVVDPVGSPAAAPVPKDAVILFDGTNLDAWRAAGGKPARWKVSDGFMEVAPGTGRDPDQGPNSETFNCTSSGRRPTRLPARDRIAATAAFSSWVIYELQVIDSYQADTYADGQAGALYGQYPPLANASRPPGEWQTYDIAFRRPRFDKQGKVLEPARFTRHSQRDSRSK